MSVETRFFEPAQGGDPVMLQHLIWFFGHPEVYVLLLQAVVAIIALVVLGRRWRVLSSWRRAMGFFGAIALAIATLALWAARNQQQYSEGIAGTPIGEDWVMYPPLANAPPAQIASFGIDVWALMAVMCAVLVIFLVLAFTKPRRLWTPILFAGTGLAVLAAGAIGAILLQNQGIDRTLHDTYYVIAHMQFVVSIVAVFLAFAASYLFFSQVIGISYRAWLGVLHWALFTLGGVCVLLPQMWLSFGGMPRRYIDYDVELSRWNWGGELGLVLAGLSLAVFALCIIEAVIRRARSGKTPPSAPSDN